MRTAVTERADKVTKKTGSLFLEERSNGEELSSAAPLLQRKKNLLTP